MVTDGAVPDDEGLSALLDSSPDPDVHTSAAAELAVILGLLAVLAAPFSIMHALALATAVAAAVCGLAGVVATSRPNVAGRALAPLGLALAIVAMAVIGLRYLGLDTAFGDTLAPSIGQWLRTLNGDVPQP